MACMTLRRVLPDTLSGRFKQRETVAVETPAILATSSKVGAAWFIVVARLAQEFRRTLFKIEQFEMVSLEVGSQDAQNVKACTNQM